MVTPVKMLLKVPSNKLSSVSHFITNNLLQTSTSFLFKWNRSARRPVSMPVSHCKRQQITSEGLPSWAISLSLLKFSKMILVEDNGSSFSILYLYHHAIMKVYFPALLYIGATDMLFYFNFFFLLLMKILTGNILNYKAPCGLLS